MVERNHVGVASNLDSKTLDDRECQRKTQVYGGTHSRTAVDADTPTQSLNIPAHHIHAYATTRQVAHLSGRRNSRLKHELVDFLVTHASSFDPDSTLFRGIENLAAVQPSAIVANFNADASRLVGSPQS